ncbi:mannose-6-phosphate isomerase [Corynebacterium phocae]|uniref:mannose-6-phosphate isomerase n=1 Tax=Corynebacterium phocae TaxID=161895 RepID=A0A1L7D4V6_9CORY|nr:mannose-6-phosphate isomerase, class I [Corynebacterium phocae]APT93097.1 mannose-6-phosphate isomerase [Corynebacterium phocae]KAA8722400.1 mannose-6-phosphate isomerase, class I [Corynebacterium phocae]
MDKLVPATRSYSWGSRTLIPELRGQTPSSTPVAELWYGAHPADPSGIAGSDHTLDEKLAANPQELGKWADNGLPFLMKLLAAGEVLSLQAHPSMEQAIEGFERENALGIGLDDKQRNYKDASHKPEILIALTPFYAMAGFRPLARTLELFRALDCPELDRYVGMLAEGDSPETESDNLRALFTTWITIPTSVRHELISAIIAAAPRVPDGWMRTVMNTVVEINQRYPGDVGVLGAILLNHIELAPGEAVFLAAGNLHSYVRGLGVEVMANSDNVLRGGLTPKYVDVPELVKVLKFASLPEPRVPVSQAGAVAEYDTPVAEFSVFRVDFPAVPEANLSQVRGPGIVLCTKGTVSVNGTSLTPGEAAWLPANGAPVVAHSDSDGQLFIAAARDLK